MAEVYLRAADDFSHLVHLLPAGREEQAKALGVLRRCRKIPGADTVAGAANSCYGRLLVPGDRSSRIAEGVAEVSAVSIMGHLRQSAEWFHRMSRKFMKTWDTRPPADVARSEGCGSRMEHELRNPGLRLLRSVLTIPSACLR